MTTIPPMMSHFKTAKSFATQRAAKTPTVTHTPVTPPFFKKSSAQVETSVTHVVLQKSGGLKPVLHNQPKSETVSVRFKGGELPIIRAKALQAGCTTNSYIRASVLGSDYVAPANPELVKALLALNLELTAHGRNINQLAKHLNSHAMTVEQGMAVLESIRRPLIQALQAVKHTLAPNMPTP